MIYLYQFVPICINIFSEVVAFRSLPGKREFSASRAGPGIPDATKSEPMFTGGFVYAVKIYANRRAAP